MFYLPVPPAHVKPMQFVFEMVGQICMYIFTLLTHVVTFITRLTKRTNRKSEAEKGGKMPDGKAIRIVYYE